MKKILRHLMKEYKMLKAMNLKMDLILFMVNMATSQSL